MPETEARTRANEIQPILPDEGWSAVEGSYVTREQCVSSGHIMGGWQRGVMLSAEYVLFYRGRGSAPRKAGMTTVSVMAGRSS